MPYTVNGYIDGVSYQVTVDGPALPSDTFAGKVSGSPNALALLSANEGQLFSQTVTGATMQLDLNDPKSIYAALQELTEVTSTDGDVPQDEPFDSGVIY